MGYSIKQIYSVESIFEILQEFDEVFLRSISSRLGSLSEYAKKLAERAILYVAEEENTILGFIAFYANNLSTKEAYISQIAVHQKYRKKGIGLDLLNFCIITSKKNSMKTVKLEVDKSNHQAILFYERFGFHTTVDASGESQYMVLYV
jgi:ribosomal protein S18 acetylase RimI-like enzyme